MEIKYKIIEANPKEHSITVRFYTDKVTEEMLVTSTSDNGEILRCRTDYHLTMWDAPFPQGEELHDWILKNAPIQWFELQEKILDNHADVAISEEIHSLVGKEHVATVEYIMKNRPVIKRKDE